MRTSLWMTCGVLAAPLYLVQVARAQTTHTVELAGMDFTPADITIAISDTVHWVWIEGFHNVESGTIVSGAGVHDQIFRSGDPTATLGTTYDVVFDQAFLDANPMPGSVYPYFCIVHAFAGMSGTITVTPGECITDADCADSDACNGSETCVSATCKSGTAPNCDDGNPCTDDTCSASTGCQHANDDTNTCDDGQSCTTNDACSNGTCVGISTAACCSTNADCDDGNPCTDDTCSASTGCQHVDDDTNSCDDKDPCTEADACKSGTCAGTQSGACCKVDSDCDDGDPCSDDVCESGFCKSKFRSPCCTSDSQCDDRNMCTDDSCRIDVCFSVANVLACDDGVACTLDDACFQGVCAGTPSVDGCCSRDSHCDDGDECTSDTCVNAACSHAPIAGCQSSTDGMIDATVDSDNGSTAMEGFQSACGATGMISALLLLVGFAALRLRGERQAESR